MTQRYFLLPFIIALYGAAIGQGQSLTFSKIPQDWQLFQRNLSSNKAHVGIVGTAAAASGYTKLEARLFNESASVQTASQNLSYAAGKASFSLNVEIPAATNNHRLEIWGYKTATGQWVLEKKVEKLLAGDVFIINGQSNAQAAASPDPSDVDEYTRSWHPPYGWGTLNLSFPGLWGARLANRIADDIKIPVAIFNQAVGALTIDTYLKDPLNPYSGNYGSLLRRFEDAGLEKKARAVIWFHGEADAWASESAPYFNNFQKLVAAWKADYAVERVYLFQMRYQSCTSPRPFILEAHRQCGDLPDVDIMSTGNAAHDMCHFYYENGYKTLGDRLFDLVSNRFYGRNVANVEAPDVAQASVSGPNEITIEMKYAAQLQAVGFPWLDFRVEGANVQVTGGSVLGNKIKLTLSGPATDATGVSYLGHPGEEPHWIVNARGVNILAFNNFPLATSGGGGAVDLELSGTSPVPDPMAFANATVQFSIKNAGTETATGVRVSLPLAPGLVYQGGNEYAATSGTFDHIANVWSLPSLAPGATASISLNYFTLNTLAKKIFGQVSACGKPDADSAPGNGIAPTPREDDEALVRLNDDSAPPPPPGNKPDLEISLTASDPAPGQWQNVQLALTVKNTGEAAASEVEIEFLVQSAPDIWSKIAYVSHNAPAGTDFNFWTGLWKIGDLAAGESRTLAYTGFTKVATAFPIFAEVKSQTGGDSDSVPGNATNAQPAEDDEAILLLNDVASNLLGSGGDRAEKPLDAADIQDFTLFPNPAGELVRFDLGAWLGRSLRLCVLDQGGILMFEKKIELLETPLFSLELAGWKNGAYAVLLESPGRRSVLKKMVVARMY